MIRRALSGLLAALFLLANLPAAFSVGLRGSHFAHRGAMACCGAKSCCVGGAACTAPDAGALCSARLPGSKTGRASLCAGGCGGDPTSTMPSGSDPTILASASGLSAPTSKTTANPGHSLEPTASRSQPLEPPPRA